MNLSELKIPRHRINVDQYYQMVEHGILAHDARVELIEGEIIDMPPQGSGHSNLLAVITQRLTLALGESAMVRCQMPLRLSRFSQPEPDLLLVVPRGREYAGRHPSAGDVLLLVEVAVTSLAYDLILKAPFYAKHGIEEVWVVDVVAGRVHVFREPTSEGYRSATVIERPETLACAAFPNVSVRFGDLF